MSISDQELQERTQALIEEVDPHAVDQFTFRGAQFDAGLALVHFPEGKGGRDSVEENKLLLMRFFVKPKFRIMTFS